MNQNPYVFIVGCPRSGTTLLQRMVSAHPDIAITPESHWIPRRFEERKGLTPEGYVTPDLLDVLLEERRFSKLRISRAQLNGLLKTAEPVSYSTFVTGIFNLYGTARGKQLVGDKTPGYARRLATLHNLWPKARFIHLIRDGRDVCLSAMNTYWKKRNDYYTDRYPTLKENPVSTAALWWECHVRLGREAASLLGPELYHEIRYESLIVNPEKECKALCSFLAVRYDDAMLRFHEGRTRKVPGHEGKRSWLPITPGLRNWKIQMPAEHIKEFEALAGDLLVELGYGRSVPRPKLQMQKRAAAIRDLFTKDARSRLGYQFPKHWEAA